ncbi:T9SS type A sorting domain-containing protein [Algibacter sp. 2305UL17-15]|uniref:T9SS type A sorting domain-containing protein n=1 Tax=Algibacter sp. 2305UL17-15 TaxID=3231268 RepID=UPI00345AEBE8
MKKVLQNNSVKKSALIGLVLLLSISNMFSQTIAIPDTNFEQALIDANIDSNGLNGNILESEAQAVINLSLNNKNINDLTGIEGFVNLNTLVVSNNNLQSIDLSANTLLEYLDFSNNELLNLDLTFNTALTNILATANALTNIDVSNCLSLTSLIVPFNNLESIDVSNNIQLQTLYCHSNGLSTLNVTNNVNLEVLYCYDNDLIELNVNGVVSLEELQCQENNLITLGVANNSALTRLHCNANELTYLNLQNGNNSNFEFFTALLNPNLTCIQVDDVAYSNNNWANIDTQSFFSENCGTTIPIPDTNFEQALIDLGYDTNGLNGNILRLEAEAVTQLDVNNKNISSIEGIQAFINITLLRCHDNNITSLDLSSNTNLITLNCRNNQLTSLDLSSNLQLESLNCFNNQIAVLDLSSNSALDSLLCDDNQLHTLNVRNGNNFNVIFFSALNNPDLHCIEVDDVSASTTNWTDIDAQTVFSEDCTSTVPIPDVNFEQALIDLGHDSNGLNGNMFLYEAQSIINLAVNNRNISSLEGIEAFENLETLNCNFNAITSLNLVGNPKLKELNAENNNLTSLHVHQNNVLLEFLRVNNNQLTNIDVSNNPLLLVLECNNNQLSTLDASNNPSLAQLHASSNNLTSVNIDGLSNLLVLYIQNNLLTFLDVSDSVDLVEMVSNNNQLSELNLVQNPDLQNIQCSNNALNRLNVSNGNNGIIDIFITTNNPELTCITVDDVAYSEANWTNIDVQTSFSEDCSPLIPIPDVNFEQALINLGYDTNGLTGNIRLYDAEAVEVLDVESNSIQSLQGIEGFTNLTLLFCADNQLSALDVSNLTNLQALNCSNNQLTDLDLSQNSNLSALSFASNQLTNIDLSNNNNLSELYCANNQLETLDLSQNTNLIVLYCRNNSLNELDIRNGNNELIATFDTMSNPELFCVSVDDVIYSESNWVNIDAQTSFNEDCGATLGIGEASELDSVSLYPNPATHQFQIKGLQEDTEITVYDINGRQIQRQTINPNQSVSIQEIPSGMYVVNIQNNSGAITKKLIVR